MNKKVTIWLVMFSFCLIVASAIPTIADTYIIEHRITGNLSTQNVTLSWNNLTDIPAGFADGIDNEGNGSGGRGTANVLQLTRTLINYSGDNIDTIQDYYDGGGLNTTFTYTNDFITNVTINDNGTMKYINLTYDGSDFLTEVVYG